MSVLKTATKAASWLARDNNFIGALALFWAAIGYGLDDRSAQITSATFALLWFVGGLMITAAKHVPPMVVYVDGANHEVAVDDKSESEVSV